MIKNDGEGLVESFRQDGYVFLPEALPSELLAEMRASVQDLLTEPGPQRFLERDGVTARAIYGLHGRDGVWRAAAERSILPRIARSLLGEDIYVYQWKVNPKSPGAGDRWEWHRDFTFWSREDGMPAPRALTAAILLEENGPESGPLQLVVGSHRLAPLPEETNICGPSAREATDWSAIVSDSLAYTVTDNSVERIGRERGIVTVCGPPGSVVYFDCNIIHGSGRNLSTYPRTLALITYNCVDNVPRDWANPRPDFFVNHYPRAIPIPGRLEDR
ncbi:phytanoyl-CoA dioxygenase family protein [Nocardia brasiliensis]|uniref:phytanoyl-CoA dioxygenase family protein n=1 Tax=Nocardia brasiliensis TaxID=37326 RepID=UPI0024565775|nr:phytanoyl-CoA dioxygenase family protein [Nocardia brasiliensis]